MFNFTESAKKALDVSACAIGLRLFACSLLARDSR